MSLKRNSYSPKKHGLSTMNEPPVSAENFAGSRYYPDMKSVYDAFSSAYRVGLDRFILGNGCENILKNVLLALKPSSMCWAKPTWEMTDVICEQLGVQRINRDFRISPDGAAEPSWTDAPAEILYMTPEQNNLININPSEIPQPGKFENIVLDISYCHGKLKEYIEKYGSRDDVVLVGSFDKSHGCGLRCGFAVFPSGLNDAVQLQRENFINKLAADFILSGGFLKEPEYEFADRLGEAASGKQTVRILNNFIVIDGNIDTDVPCRKFSIDGSEFTRIGLPSSESELIQILGLIKTL